MAEFDARAETEDTSLDGIQVRLPRFEVEWSDSLASLRALGMEDAFLPSAAHFSRDSADTKSDRTASSDPGDTLGDPQRLHPLGVAARVDPLPGMAAAAPGHRQ
jgi:hypothetical protein